MILQSDPNANKFIETQEPAIIKKAMEKLLLWAFAWGLGGNLRSELIEKFNIALTDLSTLSLPREGLFTCYFKFEGPEGEFVTWDSIKPEFNYSTDMPYFELVVPTNDTVCYSWLIE